MQSIIQTFQLIFHPRNIRDTKTTKTKQRQLFSLGRNRQFDSGFPDAVIRQQGSGRRLPLSENRPKQATAN